MGEYYLIKEFSELTGVTAKTLRYYDKINLLKPSKMSPSGYRLYSNDALLRLQQINTLKFLGYSLGEIKGLIDNMGSDITESLRMQAKILNGHIGQVQRALKLIEQLQSEIKSSKEVNWDLLVALTRVLELGNDEEQAWQQNIFTPNELKKFNTIISDLSTEIASELYRRSEINYTEVKLHLDKNPSSDPYDASGQQFAKQWVALIKEIYQEDFEIGLKIWDATLTDKLPKKYIPKYYDHKVSSYMHKAVMYYLKNQ